MKGIDLFCASQAATAIILGMDEISSSSSTSSSSSSAAPATMYLGGGRAIDRHNPIIRDARRIGKSLTPCISQQPPINPKPYSQLQNQHKGSKKSSNLINEKLLHFEEKQKKKQSRDDKGIRELGDVILGKGSANKAGDFTSPPTSSRYLLDNAGFLDALSDFDPVLALVPAEKNKSDKVVKWNESSPPSKQTPPPPPPPPPPPSSGNPDQVVVLRVSLHCKGCEGKVRKHISRMQGVTSFSIDFAAKQVTVIGDVTPLGVLASISKVKSAQLWAPQASSLGPGPESGPTSLSDIKKK